MATAVVSHKTPVWSARNLLRWRVHTLLLQRRSNISKPKLCFSMFKACVAE